MNTILLATDGSPSAVKATALAVALGAATERPLRVVSVRTTPAPVAAYAPLVALPELEEVERRRAESAAEEAADVARIDGVHVTVAVRSGDPVEAIRAEAEACAATLVAVGSRGWSPARRLLLGSVSHGLLSEAHVPVLVVPGDAELQLGEPRILLATDGSPSVGRATELALALAAATRWPLVATTAWELPSTALAYTTGDVVDQLVEGARQHAREVLDAFAGEAAAAGVEATVAAVHGSAVAAIRAEAEEVRPTLLVVGSRGWGPIRRLVLGSVSNSLVGDAPCPVLVVPRA